MMTKICDSFIFYNELDILDIRLHELFPVVDKFLVVEGSRTFTGKEKRSVFLENTDRYAPYLSKIEHVFVTDWPEDSDPWVQEFHQRDAQIKGAESLGQDDFLIISDVDEIPKREAVAALRSEKTADTVAFRMLFSYFRFDFIQLKPENGIWSTAERKRLLSKETVSGLRKSRFARAKKAKLESSDTFKISEDGGWHLSYFGDDDFVRNKIRSFSHQEYNTQDFLEQIDIKRLLEAEADLFGRGNHAWAISKHPLELPSLVQEDIGRFEHYFVNPQMHKPKACR